MKILSKSFGKKLILENIEFDISRGEKVAIIGRNGAGKTTLLKIMAGIQKADRGEISYFNEEKTSNELKIAFLPQNNPLIADLSVKDNLWLWKEKCSSCEDILNDFDLLDVNNVRIKNLSGGMQRRVAIACIMQNKPQILVLDEPTASLDLVYKKSIRDNMEKFSKEGLTIIYSTHDIEEIFMADKIILLKDKTASIVSNLPKNIKTIYELIE